MNKSEFLSKWKNRGWSYLIEIPEVEELVKDYSNTETIQNLIRSLHDLLEETKKTKPEFKIVDILRLSPKDARALTWSACQSMLQWDKGHRRTQQLRTWSSQFYEFHTDKKLVWKRRHTISTVPQWTDSYVPRHKDIFLIVDHCSNIRDKCIILLMYSGLSNKPIGRLRLRHITAILEKYKQDKEIPLIIKVTSELIPKRFRSNTVVTWLPTLISKDCADLLLRYYEKKRKSADDNDYFFITRENMKLTEQRISVQVREAMDRASVINPRLKKSYPYLLRDAFYNRLIAGHMEDSYRELLMMHSTGIREHYFDEEYHRKKIIEQYLECEFNRETSLNHIEKGIGKINDLETEVGKLRKMINGYEKIFKIEVNGEKTDLRPKRLRAETNEPSIVKISNHDVDKYIELKGKGYIKTMENHEYIVMEKT